MTISLTDPFMTPLWLLRGCRRWQPTRGTVRFLERDVDAFVQRQLDKVRRTKRPLSA